MGKIIDINALNQLPTDGTTLDQLRSHDENDDVNDEAGASMGGNEPGPEQGSETGDADSDKTVRVAEARATTNQDCETETI